MIIMGRLIKITLKKYTVIQCNIQADSITTNLKFKIYFTLPELRATETVTWDCHVDDSAKVRYETVLSRDILTSLGMNLKFSDHVIEAYDGTFKRSAQPMVDLGVYEF